MLLSFIVIIVSLAVLIYSADFLVKGAASISHKMKIPPIVIGLTVVSFGTSAPELLVNLMAAFNDSADLAIGNIVGSNISNILLILGIVACITTLKVQKSTTYKEIPFALLASVILLIMANDQILDSQAQNLLSRTDGLTLFGFFLIFMYYTFNLAKNGQTSTEDIPTYSNTKSSLFLIFGIIGLFFGGKFLVDHAVLLAKMAGLSELLIGATIIGIGTSLPELVTSVVAAKRNQIDLAVGNIIGSNIFNIFWILGITSIITPLSISPGTNFDFLAETVATILLFILIFIFKKHQLNRTEGVLFLLTYFSYLTYIIIRG